MPSPHLIVTGAVSVVQKAADVQRRVRRAHRAAQPVVRKAKRAAYTAETVVEAPGRVAHAGEGTVEWVTAPVGSGQRAPRFLKWLVVLLLLFYIPWTVVRAVPDVKVLPGFPLSPTWGSLFGMVFPGDQGGDGWFSSYCPPADAGSGVVLASSATPAAEVPWLTGLASGVGTALREDIADPDNFQAYVDWMVGVGRVAVSAGAAAFTGGEPSEEVREYDAAYASYQTGPCAPTTMGSAVAPAVLGACPPSGSGAEGGLSPRALRVLRCGAASFPELSSFGGVGPRGNKSDHPHGNAVDLMIPRYQSSTGQALGGRVADFYAAHAEEFGVSYIIWADRINSFDGRGWRPYKHPICGAAACGGDTLRHLDHVHVSVESGGMSA